MHPAKLDSNWIAARASSVLESGETLTTTKPPAAAASPPWMDAVVPGTILATLLKNKMIPDPFYGMENKNIIDIADSGREYYTFWHFTSFKLSVDANSHVWLQFRGINYQADVFLNGHKKSLSKGMFQRHILDVTEWVSFHGPNYLAVLVHPPDNPGRIPPQGGQGGDHQIAKDVAAQYVEGWDWTIPARDRNTGIWDEVSLSFSGPVRIFNPHLVSSFFDNFERVYLHISLDLRNTSSKLLNCLLKLQVAIDVDNSFHLIEKMKEEELQIQASTTVQHTFLPLFFYKPQLWWPNGMGKQPLYKVDIVVEVQEYGESDAWNHAFGFRKIESFIDPHTQGRMFKVNGEPLFIRGGNWIVSDGLLRLSDKRYKTDIDFHADMNMNMIRVWGGGIAERPEFYENCDRRGILVWQEFWITGDCNGGSDWPLDHELFLTCARDTVMMLRNHSSLALWVGGNEHIPPYDINDALKKSLQLHPYFQEETYTEQSNHDPFPYPFPPTVDPSTYLDGTRVYIEGSLSDGFGSGGEDFTDGPYKIQNPENFFHDNFYSYGFNPEVGSVGMPVAATIRAIFPPEAWEPPRFVKQLDGNFQEVPNPTWEYHNFHPYSDPVQGIHDQIETYGEPKDLDDYCNKAQLANFIQYQALMEGWNSRMWTKYTGVLMWKNQNPWTGLRGQFYDHFFDQTAGFFGIRSACEPIHVQLNLFTYFIEVVNTTANQLKNVNVEADIWDLEGANPYHQYVQLTVPPKKTMEVFEVQYRSSKDAKPVYFLLLKLTDTSGEILSRNLYWLHLPGGDYKQIAGNFKTRKIPVRTKTKGLLTGSTYALSVEVENLSNQGRTGNQNLQNEESSISILSRNQIGEISNGCKLKGLMCNLISNFFISGEVSSCRLKEHRGSSVGPGVAFWLHFSVFDETKSPQVDRRILPVRFSQNYFSLVPGEKFNIDISFDYPESGRPKLLLHGWNIEETHVSLT